MNEIILDTETTGLSIKDDHRIVEIACIETQNLIPTKRIFCPFEANLTISSTAELKAGKVFSKFTMCILFRAPKM